MRTPERVAKARSAEELRGLLESVPAPDPGVRDAILERYRRLASNPARQDPGGGLRAALVWGLRAHAVREDVGLLEGAVRTYEFGPRLGGEPNELASGLRAAALLALSDLDERLAAFHAARLLADRFTAPGTREPAVTAVRLLASLGQQLVLYRHLIAGTAAGEEAAECFRALADAPAGQLAELAERWLGSGDGAALLGLTDAILGQPEADPLCDVLAQLVDESPDLDLVAYVATAVVASRRPRLIETLRASADRRGARSDAIRTALGLLPS